MIVVLYLWDLFDTHVILSGSVQTMQKSSFSWDLMCNQVLYWGSGIILREMEIWLPRQQENRQSLSFVFYFLLPPKITSVKNIFPKPVVWPLILFIFFRYLKILNIKFLKLLIQPVRTNIAINHFLHLFDHIIVIISWKWDFFSFP